MDQPPPRKLGAKVEGAEKTPQTAIDRFNSLTQRLLAVPIAEFREADLEYQKKRKTEKTARKGASDSDKALNPVAKTNKKETP